MYKTVFVAFYQGDQLKSRLKKVCTGFHASLYPCPNSNNERTEMLQGVRTRLEDLNMVRCPPRRVLRDSNLPLSPTHTGVEPNPRPSHARARRRGQGVAELEHHGEEDESHLPHLEHVQHGRHEEMFDWRMLGARRGHSDRAESPGRRFGTCR